jgi:hypothetical protein
MAVCATSANATPITTIFNFVPFGETIPVTANTGDVTTATNIDPGNSLEVNALFSDNTGLAVGGVISLTANTPVTMGATFTKSFTTGLGLFTEALTVTSVTIGTTSRDIDAVGTITCATCTLTPSTVYYTAAYTQDGGSGHQINASFTDSTTPPTTVPEPLTLSLFGVGLAGAAALRRRKKAKA